MPEVSALPACDEQQYKFIPRNVTRQRELPPVAYNLIALAPWFSMECTQAYLASARLDPIRAFIFYKPNNSSNKPQGADSPVWSLEDDGAWKKNNQFPIFAISGTEGSNMMTQLSLYSGNVTSVPNGTDIERIYEPKGGDLVRIWTQLNMDDPTDMPALWSFFLIVIGALLAIISGVSLTMHFVQRRRRNSLERRVCSGEVDLEAMGIIRLIVPASHVESFPLFTYQRNPDSASPPLTPIDAEISQTTGTARTTRRARKQPRSRRIAPPDPVRSPTVRSQRSSIAYGFGTAATNFQPNCQICLEMFEHRVTIVRELPCYHIFHPECIEEFLTKNSSLCPMCKHCMLPRGFSPKITNGMVRRERAITRLRERVDLDDYSLESGERKSWLWVGKLHWPKSSQSTQTTIDSTPMSPLGKSRPALPGHDTPKNAPATEALETSLHGNAPITSESADQLEEQAEQLRRSAPTKTNRRRKKQSRELNALSTQPEHGEETIKHEGRGSPSSFARERMRQMAARNAPVDDPDANRRKCKFPICS